MGAFFPWDMRFDDEHHRFLIAAIPTDHPVIPSSNDISEPPAFTFYGTCAQFISGALFSHLRHPIVLTLQQ